MTLRVGFLMEQNAGHLTNYRNLRKVVEASGPVGIDPTWHELSYRRPEGRMERLRDDYLPFVPTYMTGNARMVMEFRRGIKAAPYDAVFTNSWAGMFCAHQMARVPTVIDFDSTPRQVDRMPEYGSPHDPPPLAALKYRLQRRAYRSSRLLHAWSNWAKQSVVSEYGVAEEKVVVNPPGVDLDFFTPPENARPEHSGPARVLFVGGDFRRKGGDLLLEWFRHQEIGRVELDIVTRDEVASGPGVNVHHDVRPNTDQALRLYQACDVFVLPSLAECFGIATIEAMATGAPVVVSDVGGTGDIVEPGHNGFITTAGDARDFGAALSAVLSDGSRRRAMGSRSRQVAEERFDVQRNALRTVGLLCDLAGGRGRVAA